MNIAYNNQIVVLGKVSTGTLGYGDVFTESWGHLRCFKIIG